MRSLSGACALLLLMACGTTEDRSGLVRRPLSQASQGGWVRLPLDGEAQAQMPSLWVGDAKGPPPPPPPPPAPCPSWWSGRGCGNPGAWIWSGFCWDGIPRDGPPPNSL